MSVNIMSMVKDAVSQQVMNKIGGMIGLDQSKTSSAFETAAGSILGGLMNKASSPKGAEAVFGAVQQQDTGILDKLGDLLGGGEATDNFQKQGGGILDSVFGSGNQAAQKAVGSSLGLGSGMVGKLMSMAAPILMGVIGNYVKSKALNAVGLGSLLGQQGSHLSGLLPSSLTSNLGFGNLLGSATGAASNIAGAATGAASNVAGAASNAAGSVAGGIGNVAGNVAGGVGNVAGSVGGAASNVAGAATGAAGDAAAAGGGFLKKLIPVGILGAILLGLWSYVISPMMNGGGVGDAISNVGQGIAGAGGELTAGLGDAAGGIAGGIGDAAGGIAGGLGDAAGGIAGGIGDATGSITGGLGDAAGGITGGVGNLAGGMGFELPAGVDLSALGGTQEALMGPIGEISQGFTGLATGGEGAATGLADKLGGFGTALEGMGIGNMAEPQRAAVGGILGQFTGMIEGLMGNVPGPLQGIVQPAVDKLMQTISGLGL